MATHPRQPLILLATERLLGELDTAAGRYEAADHHLRSALALAEACQAPYERALTLVSHAALLCGQHDGDSASIALADARATCAVLRATPALARMDALAARLPRHTAPNTPPAGLTAREFDVLRLLVEGHSDRAIAQQLSIGSRTVQSHVANILSKLGVSTRTAAASHAVRHGLV
jgi:DNA-binding CsgD family transcriptional regulator